MTKRLYRSRKYKMIGGVAGGLAEYFDIDPVFMRALFIITALGYGIGFIAYIVLWIIVPLRPKIYIDPDKGIFTEQTEEEPVEITGLSENSAYNRKTIFGAVLIALGIIFFLDNFIVSISFKDIYPLLIIGIGAFVLYRGFKEKSGEKTHETE